MKPGATTQRKKRKSGTPDVRYDISHHSFDRYDSCLEDQENDETRLTTFSTLDDGIEVEKAPLRMRRQSASKQQQIRSSDLCLAEKPVTMPTSTTNNLHSMEPFTTSMTLAESPFASLTPDASEGPLNQRTQSMTAVSGEAGARTSASNNPLIVKPNALDEQMEFLRRINAEYSTAQENVARLDGTIDTITAEVAKKRQSSNEIRQGIAAMMDLDTQLQTQILMQETELADMIQERNVWNNKVFGVTEWFTVGSKLCGSAL